jgi:hypothetical protein
VELAALAIAVLSLTISVTSAAAAFRRNRRDTARRHVEQTPTFDLRVEPVDQGGTRGYQLRFTLTSAWPLDRVSTRIVNDKAGVVFYPTQNGVQGNRPLQADGGPLRPGETLTWRLLLGSTYDDIIGLVVTCASTGGTWELPATVSTPGRPPRLY